MSNSLTSSAQEKPASSNVVWHSSHITPRHRQALLGHHPIAVWFTGLSASGKSTLAFALEHKLIETGHAAYVLDGDNIRHGLNGNLGFSHADRSENIRRIAEVAKLMNDAGLIVLTAFISPYREDRELARRIIGAQYFYEVHVSTPLATCEQRDPKGMYRRARAGEIKHFTGVDDPYEPPQDPQFIIDTSQQDLSACTHMLFDALRDKVT